MKISYTLTRIGNPPVPQFKFASILSMIVDLNARGVGVRKEGKRTFFRVTTRNGDFEIEHTGIAEDFEQNLFQQLQAASK